mmetsp:Transcript_27839/g.70359  ORF Transcript_27839/g.70359 Transcript_27839/m.70359 type:complete len:387 (-) Transcript_27839:405-1565(-)|eukprot:CAMPEP_0178995470 /NCGR_PEP_ID=MMETSP0795-20121207/7844_1 /TAXON_ID=88552 /ORGANISM="Amoebophrya sp., Strain Ameob2" /LENGTH=386 /DNA_ID=CAMNT_0020687779 /DNA_START=168 /DNA_END=1328 /DNA_ORIENTATION=+
MSEFFDLRRRDLLEEYFYTLQEANNHEPRERHAAIKIQSFYRASNVRFRWHAVHHAGLFIQRVARGMLGRLRAKAFLIKRAQDVNMAYFNHAASTIQKVFRGYWSRQYTHCMKSRKDYLAQVASVGDKTNTWLKGFEGEEQLKHQRRTEEERKSTFNKLASQLHHLVSTQKIPGVYNPPYSEALPTAFNIPIEQHLRLQSTARMPASLKRPNLNRSIPSNHRPLNHTEKGITDAAKIRGGPPQPLAKRVPLVTRTANAGRMQAIQGPFRTKEQIDISNVKAYDQHRSIQASSRYDVVQQTKRLEARLSKITRVAPDEFVSRKIEHGKLKPSVNAETRYLDRPVEFRQDYTELPKIKDKPPFFTAVPGGKLLADYDDEKYIVGAMPV